MNVFDFISKSDYAEIKRKVENKEAFEHETTKGEIAFRLHNSFAGCDFCDGKTKQGDYFVSIGYNYKTGGCGCPIDVDKFLQHFETYETATKYIDKFIGNLEKYGYETLKNNYQSRPNIKCMRNTKCLVKIIIVHAA